MKGLSKVFLGKMILQFGIAFQYDAVTGFQFKELVCAQIVER
jgi:hypothetical protein